MVPLPCRSLPYHQEGGIRSYIRIRHGKSVEASDSIMQAIGTTSTECWSQGRAKLRVFSALNGTEKHAT